MPLIFRSRVAKSSANQDDIITSSNTNAGYDPIDQDLSSAPTDPDTVESLTIDPKEP